MLGLKRRTVELVPYQVPLKAALYDQHKLELAEKFPKDRANYTKGKQKLIDSLLAEAADWKHSLEMP